MTRSSVSHLYCRLASAVLAFATVLVKSIAVSSTPSPIVKVKPVVEIVSRPDITYAAMRTNNPAERGGTLFKGTASTCTTTCTFSPSTSATVMPLTVRALP